MALVWPVRFVKDVPRNKPSLVTLRNVPYVLWWSNGAVRAAEDACPHRLAKLSSGDISGNKLICGYHAWEFDEQGVCVTIPQVPPGTKYPKACNLRTVSATMQDGIVWLAQVRGCPPYYPLATAWPQRSRYFSKLTRGVWGGSAPP